MAEAKPAGPIDRPIPKELSEVEALVSNRTLLVQPVAPEAAVSGPVKVFKAGNLKAVVEQAGPTLTFTVTRAGKDAKEAVMRYGGRQPDQVLKDFEPDNLVTGVELEDAPKDAPAVARFPLLEQRLTRVALDDLLKNPAIKEALKNPARRSEVLRVIKDEITRIQRLIAKASDKEEVDKP
jgi:hypothetical protein